MKRCVLAVLVFAILVRADKPSERPRDFYIARHTFVDFGPPLDFYALFRVHETEAATVVERIELTPHGDPCFQLAKVESATASIKDSVADLLGGIDVCAIPDSDLRRESKRCKNCLVFSGAYITMQVQCGQQTRRIPFKVLDRDMFASAPRTPQRTSANMSLMERLDSLFGKGVLDRPIFAVPTEPSHPALRETQLVGDIGEGKFDNLFEHAPDKPSDLVREARQPPPSPSVELMSSTPFRPTSFPLIGYPPLARMTHTEGPVLFAVTVDVNGGATNLRFIDGHPLLRPSVESAVAGWKFPSDAAGQEIHATIEFKTNCSPTRP